MKPLLDQVSLSNRLHVEGWLVLTPVVAIFELFQFSVIYQVERQR